MGRIDWRAVLAPEQPWQIAYPIVEREARAILTDGKVRSTAELMGELLSRAELEVRGRLLRALNALATHGLADCARREGARTIRVRVQEGRWTTRTINSWQWGSRNSEAEPERNQND